MVFKIFFGKYIFFRPHRLLFFCDLAISEWIGTKQVLLLTFCTMYEMDLFKTRKTESLWFQQSIDLLWHMIYTSKLYTFSSWTSTQWQLEVDPCFSLGQECLWWALNLQGQTLAPPATRKVRQTHPSAHAILHTNN